MRDLSLGPRSSISSAVHRTWTWMLTAGVGAAGAGGEGPPVAPTLAAGGVGYVARDRWGELPPPQFSRRHHVLQELRGAHDLPPIGPDSLPVLPGERERQGAPAARDQLLRLPLQDAYLRQKSVRPADARLVHGVELPDVPGPRGVVPGPVGHDDARQLLVGRTR